FNEKYFDPIVIPTIKHIPWVKKNIPILPGIYQQVKDIIQEKINSGVYEPSSSSYCSKLFCILKKDGTSLRLVHNLQPLNQITIKDASVPPLVEHMAEFFRGRGCYRLLDLFITFDQHSLAVES
ncbi:hypothetical protein JAAARDRAFT_139793, partial [Jaapia argillacea MUCL 33604]